MIERIFGKDEVNGLPERGIEAGKIRALLDAYGTDYDFCRFFRQDGTYISALDGSFVLCAAADAYLDEIAQFLCLNGFAEVFCASDIGSILADKLSASCSEVNAMRFTGATLPIVNYDNAPSLSDVYSIIREGFDIPFEAWYLDMSHRVRHGVSVCCTLEDKAALVIQHDICGEALISQVACRSAFRGQGHASSLVVSVASALSPSEVYVLCEDKLVSFYEKCGFVSAGRYAVINRR